MASILCYRAEGAVPIVKKHVPVFAHQAKIYSVDTLEGILCTHEVMLIWNVDVECCGCAAAMLVKLVD